MRYQGEISIKKDYIMFGRIIIVSIVKKRERESKISTKRN